jgi:hypothetical protein
MEKRVLFLGMALVLFLASPAFATAYTFTSFDCPDSVSTFAYGINNSGQIVGAYINATGGATYHGFLKGRLHVHHY